jgi:alkanesulfonate monooxygenase SsuD/methylene tetrahydromethanopterin reductase-like flavin-dependent oxidoreductase (luciferase family)
VQKAATLARAPVQSAPTFRAETRTTTTMKLGIFSNGQRHNQLAADSYAQDLLEVIAADELGYDEAWISEHVGVHRIDTQPAPELFIAAAAQRTSHIRMGVGVRVLPLYHPVDVATVASACDHMTGGRYMFGFGPGAAGDLQTRQRGIPGVERHPRMMESLDLILKCWTATEPFDYDGQFFHGQSINVLPKPLQKPYMPISMASTTPSAVEWAGRSGFGLLTSQYESPSSLAELAATYLRGAAERNLPLTRDRLTVSRQIYVSDSVRQARDELRPTAGQDMEDIRTHFGFLFSHYLPSSGSIDDVNFDQLADGGMFIVGDPDTVSRQLCDLYRECGGFGHLLLVMGKDWGTLDNRLRSLRLFKEEVWPRLAGLEAVTSEEVA